MTIEQHSIQNHLLKLAVDQGIKKELSHNEREFNLHHGQQIAYMHTVFMITPLTEIEIQDIVDKGILDYVGRAAIEPHEL